MPRVECLLVLVLHQAMSLCHANLPEEAARQLAHERGLLLDAFCRAGVSTPETLELLLPAARYNQVIGVWTER